MKSTGAYNSSIKPSDVVVDEARNPNKTFNKTDQDESKTK
jgi:hypothetical protein